MNILPQLGINVMESHVTGALYKPLSYIIYVDTLMDTLETRVYCTTQIKQECHIQCASVSCK